MSEERTSEELTVRFSEAERRGHFTLFGAGGEQLGEMTFSRADEALVIVDHTETDPSLKGRGAGRLLFDTMVAWARESGTKVLATCPFALAMFERDESSRDVLQP